MNRAPVRRQTSSARSNRMRRWHSGARVGGPLRSALTTVLPGPKRQLVAFLPMRRSLASWP